MRRLLVALLLCTSIAWAQSSIDLARSAHRAGELARAEGHYREAIASAPGAFAGLFEYGLLLLELRRWAEAAELLNRASVADPGRPEHYLARANAYLEDGKAILALAALVNGEAACKLLPEYWVMRGGTEAFLGKRAEAVRSLGAARTAGPERADIAYQVGVTFLATLGSAREAEEHLASAVVLDGKNRDYAVAYAEALLGVGKWAQAHGVVAGLLQAWPGDREFVGYAVRACASASTLEGGLGLADRLADYGVSRVDVLLARSAVYGAHEMRSEARRALDDALALDGGHLDALVRRSALRLETGDGDGSLSDARAAVSAHPGEAVAHRALYHALSGTGRKREAERALRTWLSLARTDPAPYSLLGDHLRARSAFVEAAAIFEALVSLRPNDARALDNAAASYISAGNAERAIVLLSDGIARGVKSADLYLRLALAHRQLAETAEALGALREMRAAFPKDTRGWTLAAATHESSGRFADAIDLYKDLEATHPDLPDGLDGQARCYAAMGKHLEAAVAWRKVGERYDAAIPALIAAGRQYVAAGASEEAESMWGGVLERRGSEVLVLGGYAQFLVMSDRKAEAVDVFRKMIAISKSNSQPYLAAAELLVGMQMKQEALAILESGADHCFGEIMYMRQFAMVAADAGEPERFDAAIEKLFSLELYSRHTVSTWIDLRNRMGKLAEGVAELERAVEKNAANADLWAGLSRAHALSGNDAAALIALDRAIDADPKDLELLRTYVVAAESSGDDARSARGYELIARIVPSDVGSWLKAAAYYHQSGAKEKAIAVVREAAKLHPENEDVAAALTRFGG